MNSKEHYNLNLVIFKKMNMPHTMESQSFTAHSYKHFVSFVEQLG